MRTFEGNLSAYHALNATNDIYMESMAARLARAKSTKEIDAIMRETEVHFKEQGERYKELGEEMAKIMDVKWWQFWK